jgi:protein NRD1
MPLTAKEPSLNTNAVPGVEKDEFGSDLRPQSPRGSSASTNGDNLAQPPPLAVAASVKPINQINQMTSSPIPTIAAATTSRSPDILDLKLSQPGLDKFDLATFDFTAPSSWEALGKMWEVTNGYAPTQEALMQFIMAGRMVGASNEPSMAAPEPGWSPQGQGQQGWQDSHSVRGGKPWRGRGRGGLQRGGRGGGYGYGNNRDTQDQWSRNQETDAIVLGGDTSGNEDIAMFGVGERNEEHTASPEEPTAGGLGGRMQRICDKWVFVRDATSGVV